MFPTISRDRHGIPHVEACDEAGLYFGQGAVHATDRGMQILLMRLLGQGRISECLDASDVSLRMDQFFRRANWSANPRGKLTVQAVVPVSGWASIKQVFLDGRPYAGAMKAATP